MHSQTLNGMERGQHFVIFYDCLIFIHLELAGVCTALRGGGLNIYYIPIVSWELEEIDGYESESIYKYQISQEWQDDLQRTAWENQKYFFLMC